MNHINNDCSCKCHSKLLSKDSEYIKPFTEQIKRINNTLDHNWEYRDTKARIEWLSKLVKPELEEVKEALELIKATGAQVLDTELDLLKTRYRLNHYIRVNS